MNEKTLYVGVIGCDHDNYSIDDAKIILEDSLDEIEKEYIETDEYDKICVVIKPNKIGIPLLAYDIAIDRQYDIIGISSESKDTDLLDLEDIIFIGSKQGQESQYFISYIDVLVKIGGGEFEEKEMELAVEEDISILEYEVD